MLRRKLADDDSHTENDMSADQLAGRLCALEVIALTALGMYLSNSKNDPEKVDAVMERLRGLIAVNAAELSHGARSYAIQYGNALLDMVSANLQALRGEGAN